MRFLFACDVQGLAAVRSGGHIYPCRSDRCSVLALIYSVRSSGLSANPPHPATSHRCSMTSPPFFKRCHSALCLCFVIYSAINYIHQCTDNTPLQQSQHSAGGSQLPERCRLRAALFSLPSPLRRLLRRWLSRRMAAILT